MTNGMPASSVLKEIFGQSFVDDVQNKKHIYREMYEEHVKTIIDEISSELGEDIEPYLHYKKSVYQSKIYHEYNNGEDISGKLPFLLLLRKLVLYSMAHSNYEHITTLTISMYAEKIDNAKAVKEFNEYVTKYIDFIYDRQKMFLVYVTGIFDNQ